MIRVAICDDEYETLQCLDETVSQYGVQKGLELSIDTFSKAEALKTQIKSKGNYQIYILDMLMPKVNGIEIGQAVRSQDRQAAIIYLTSSMDFAYQAFGVFAQRYLLKPMKEAEFYEAMDFAVGNVFRMQQALHIKTADGIQKILYHEIEYIENAARALHIFLTNGTEIVSRLLRKSFESDAAALLENSNFIQTHKSFIINLSHISLYDPGQATMRSGAQIPISKKRQAQVKWAYLNYISENY